MREFLLLAQTLSYSEAAERLFIAQSTLTRHVQALERELGGELLVRTPRRIALSAFGEQFLPFAGQLVQTEDAMRRTLAAARTGRERVAFDYGAGLSERAAALLREFRQAEPGIELVLWHSGECVQELRSGRCSFAVASEGQLPPGEFHEVERGVSRLMAAVPAEHPLAEREGVTLRDLAPWRIVIHHANAGPDGPFLAAWRAAGLQPKLLVSKSDAPLTDYVVANQDIAIGSKGILRSGRSAQIRLLAIEPPILCRNLIAYRRSPALTAAERRFLAFLLEHRAVFWGAEEEISAPAMQNPDF